MLSRPEPTQLLNMEQYLYTSDSSDSDTSGKTLDFSHLILDYNEINERFIRTKDKEQVETLLLHENRLNEVPSSITTLTNLKTLNVSTCGLMRISDHLGDCPLTCLIARNNRLTDESLPKTLRPFRNLRELNFSGNGFARFPNQLLELTELKYLYLSGNQITEITEEIWRLERLQILSLAGNRLTEVPSALGQLKSLQALILHNNFLENLPSSIACLTNLKTLQLHNNKLKTLPTEIITLKCLTELSLRDNPLVVRFVSDMSHNPPSLLEIAAREIKTNHIRYSEGSIPRNLYDYLNNSHSCVNPKCKGVFFDNRVEHIKFVDFCGKYRLPLLQYLCSSKCIGPSNGDEEEVNGAMIKKVLLG